MLPGQLQESRRRGARPADQRPASLREMLRKIVAGGSPQFEDSGRQKALASCASTILGYAFRGISWLQLELDNTAPHCDRDRLGPIFGDELFHDVPNVHFDGFLCNEEALA